MAEKSFLPLNVHLFKKPTIKGQSPFHGDWASRFLYSYKNQLGDILLGGRTKRRDLESYKN